eukprot:4791961-Pleurochrysis_carterae.AAC.1
MAATPSTPLVGGAEVRAEARRVENILDAKLVLYARFARGDEKHDRRASSGQGGACGGSDLVGMCGSLDKQPADLEHEIEQLLMQLGEVNDRMSRLYTSSTSVGSGSTSRHVLQRHREILHDLAQEFNKIKTNLKSAEERQELLSTVRANICEHRHSTDMLLRERNALHTCDRLTNDVISNAEATKAALANQRSGEACRAIWG